MKAAVVEKWGGPEVLAIKELPTPTPEPGWILIRIMAFGLNRAELFTRQGYSPGAHTLLTRHHRGTDLKVKENRYAL